MDNYLLLILFRLVVKEPHPNNLALMQARGYLSILRKSPLCRLLKSIRMRVVKFRLSRMPFAVRGAVAASRNEEYAADGGYAAAP